MHDRIVDVYYEITAISGKFKLLRCPGEENLYRGAVSEIKAMEETVLEN